MRTTPADIREYPLNQIRVPRLLQHRRLALLTAARGPVLGGALAAAVTFPLTRFVLPLTGSDWALLLVATGVFVPLYLWLAVPRLRVDTPAVMEVTLERALPLLRWRR